MGTAISVPEGRSFSCCNQNVSAGTKCFRWRYFRIMITHTVEDVMSGVDDLASCIAVEDEETLRIV
jgi:hypothetical protein